MDSETLIYIDGGDITVESSYEGIEALDIIINDGLIDLTADDDGINISDGTVGAATAEAMGAGSGQRELDVKALGGVVLEGHSLTINGGELIINSDGDGLDSNGNMYMSGGTVTIYGTTSDREGAVDYNGEFIMTGGELMAAGSMGMMQAPSESSTQNIMKVGLKKRFCRIHH